MQLAIHLAGVDGQFATHFDFAFAPHHALEHDVVGVRIDVQVVANANGLNQKAQFGRQFFTHAFDAAHQFAASVLVDQRNQAVANLQTTQLDLVHIVPVQIFGGLGGGSGLCHRFLGGFFFHFTANHHQAQTRSSSGQGDEHHVGHAGHQAQNGQDDGRYEQGGWIGKLGARLLGNGLGSGDAGDDDGGGQRQQQRRNLRHQSVTNGEQGVNLACFSDRQIVLHHANGQTADQVDQQNQQASNGITTDKLRGTVHGAKEIGFL